MKHIIYLLFFLPFVVFGQYTDSQLHSSNNTEIRLKNYLPARAAAMNDSIIKSKLSIQKNLSDLNSASTARTNLGATTVGGNIFTLTNPSAVRYLQLNADNTVSTLDAATYLSNIGGQPLDGDLTALSALSGTNTIYYRSASNTWSPVTIGGNLSFITGTLNGQAGTVTSIATTSPITGGTITSTGTIACAACVTSAASLTSNALMTGAGSQGSQTITTGTTGQALISGGTTAPTWYAPTAGSLLFAGPLGILQQDNSNLFWDDSNNRLGIGLTTPTTSLEVFSQDANNSSIGGGISVVHNTSGTPASGISVGIYHNVQTAASNWEDLAVTEVGASEVTSTAENGFYKTRVMSDGAIATTREAYFGKKTTLTESSATAFARLSLSSSEYAGGEIVVSVQANDASDFQVRTLKFQYSAVNKAGTSTVSITTPTETAATSTGTLTVTITAVDSGSGNIDFKANAASSLTQTSLKAQCTMIKNYFGTVSSQ